MRTRERRIVRQNNEAKEKKNYFTKRRAAAGIIHREQTKKKETFKLLWLTTRGVATAFESLLLPLGKVKIQPKLSTICFRTVIVDLFALVGVADKTHYCWSYHHQWDHFCSTHYLLMVCSLVVYDHITDRKVLGGVGPASSVGTSLARWTWRSAEMHIRKSAFTTTSSTTTPDFIEDTIRCCSTTKLMVARMKKHVTHTRYSNSSRSQYDWKKSGKLMALPSLLPGHEPKVWAKSVLSKTSVKEPKK